MVDPDQHDPLQTSIRYAGLSRALRKVELWRRRSAPTATRTRSARRAACRNTAGRVSRAVARWLPANPAAGHARRTERKWPSRLMRRKNHVRHEPGMLMPRPPPPAYSKSKPARPRSANGRTWGDDDGPGVIAERTGSERTHSPDLAAAAWPWRQNIAASAPSVAGSRSPLATVLQTLDRRWRAKVAAAKRTLNQLKSDPNAAELQRS